MRSAHLDAALAREELQLTIDRGGEYARQRRGIAEAKLRNAEYRVHEIERGFCHECGGPTYQSAPEFAAIERRVEAAQKAALSSAVSKDITDAFAASAADVPVLLAHIARTAAGGQP